MTTIKSLALALCLGSFALVPLRADQSDKKTVIKLEAPLQVPTMTLQPGSYTLKLLESTSNRHIVTIWDQDGMKLLTTVLAVPNYRLKPTGDSTFTMWEAPANQPQALRSWFYPGDNFGQEFAYPKAKAAELTAVTHEEVPALSADDQLKFGSAPQSSAVAETAQVHAESPAAPAAARVNENVSTAVPAKPEPAETVTAVTPEPAPAASAATKEAPQAAAQEPASPSPTPTPAPAPAPIPAEMPATASHWRELLLIGVAMMIAGLSTFFGKKEPVS